jgi:ACS family sodium-dependent inorganic phosphate cotransporter
LLGISNTVATIPGIAGNLVTAAILAGREDDWGLVFSLGAGINIFGAIVFAIFAKGEPQFGQEAKAKAGVA